MKSSKSALKRRFVTQPGRKRVVARACGGYVRWWAGYVMGVIRAVGYLLGSGTQNSPRLPAGCPLPAMSLPLNALIHGSFDFTELTRSECASVRERTVLLGVRVPCSDRIRNRESPLHDLTYLHM